MTSSPSQPQALPQPSDEIAPADQAEGSKPPLTSPSTPNLNQYASLSDDTAPMQWRTPSTPNLRQYAALEAHNSSTQLSPRTPTEPSEKEGSQNPSLYATTASSAPKHKLTARAHFFLVFIALCVASFLSALDLTTISTALPTIVADLQNDAIKFGRHKKVGPSGSTEDTAQGTYIWIGAAYTIAGMAVLPWTGGLVEIWGRKGILLSSLFFFLFGSIICGASHSLQMMIVGRVIQGVGDGGIISLAEIVVADLVPLSERGTYEGILGVVWATASAIGPPIGGIFSRKDRWRWLFYLNIPITVIAIIMISCFMHMKKPKTDIKSKVKDMDLTGNALLILATVGFGLALTWGGARYPWASAAVLVPLIFSIFLFAAFFYLELFKIKNPTVPKELLSNRTAVSAHLTAFMHGVVTMGIIYVMPTYFQAVRLSSTIMSGAMVLPFSITVAVVGITSAVSIEYSGRYVPQNHIGWFFTVIGVPLLLLLGVNSTAATWISVQFPIAIGCGVLFVAPQFPCLAAVAVQLSSKALAMNLFFASFGQTMGIMLAEAVFQSSVHSQIKSPLIQALAANGSLPFDIEEISSPYSMHFSALRHIPEEAAFAIRSVYNSALRHVWYLLIPFAAVGWIACFAMKEIEMHDEVDERFAADIDAYNNNDAEKAIVPVTISSSTKQLDTPASELSRKHVVDMQQPRASIQLAILPKQDGLPPNAHPR